MSHSSVPSERNVFAHRAPCRTSCSEWKTCNTCARRDENLYKRCVGPACAPCSRSTLLLPRCAAPHLPSDPRAMRRTALVETWSGRLRLRRRRRKAVRCTWENRQEWVWVIQGFLFVCLFVCFLGFFWKVTSWSSCFAVTFFLSFLFLFFCCFCL